VSHGRGRRLKGEAAQAGLVPAETKAKRRPWIAGREPVSRAGRQPGLPLHLALFRYESFYSVWYWALTVLVWTAVCHRTLGVPHDLILRAARLPEAAARVDLLARIAAERIAGIGDAAGVPIAAACGFGLAALAALGFRNGVEAAQAAFLLLFPLAIVGIGILRLARNVRRTGLSGEALRRRLSRRRMLNQAIAIAAMLAAAAVALSHPPRGLLY